ncbi:MAG TPA: fused MFS/spermidine synthase [Chloroflexota bacterium]|nr:fused MFS/spermidine synthase [Chloroflexota bacterium]
MTVASPTAPRAARRAPLPPLLPLLLVLFFGSGISGLIYELVWLRYLTLVFGVTIYAVSTVLSAFMGGLALGGFLAGRIADRVTRPLRLYGLIEVGIGLSALLTPPAFGLLQTVYRGLYPSLPHDLTSLSLVRFVLACLILLVPTTLMGATLPIVVRSTLGRTTSLGTNLSLLYASNTAGGITGAYTAGFILIGAIGIRATTLTAAVINVAVGLLAIALDYRLHQTSQTHPAPTRDATASTAGAPDRPPKGALRLLLTAFFLSGFASLGYQVIWTRILAIYFEATTYAFTLILCTFLLGIAAGSYAIAPLINRRTNWLFWAALMEWGIGLTALVSIAVIARLSAIVETLRWLPVLEHTVSGEQRVIGLMCFLTIIPTTLLLGAAFPVIMRLYAGGEDATVGRRLGRAYAANVCGSIAGSWASGFVLIPLLGTHTSLVLLAAANVLIGLGLLRYALRGAALSPLRRPRILVPVGLALALGATALTPDFYGSVFSRLGDRVIWYEEGLEQTVSILQGPDVRRMYLNGWHQANDTPQMLQLHTLIGHLPMLVQPTTGRSERSVLVIGLGGGATAGAAASYRGAHLRVVELSPSVVRGATYFSHVNGEVVKMVDGRVVPAANVDVHEDDGRNYLLLAGDKYDVIMADAIRPRAAGSGALYSLEYYRLARAALADGGVMVQWIDTQIPDNQYRMLLRTFLEAYPNVTGWAGGALFVGSERPYRVDPTVVAQRLAGANPRLLAPAGLSTADGVLNLYLAGDAELRAWVGPGPVISDDHPYNEFFRALPQQKDPPDFGSLRISSSP